MSWYGQNKSKRETVWSVGDLIRYDSGPTALMRITSVRYMRAGDVIEDIAKDVRYYGRAFHSTGTCTGRYHGQCYEPDAEDVESWKQHHDPITDEWLHTY